MFGIRLVRGGTRSLAMLTSVSGLAFTNPAFAQDEVQATDEIAPPSGLDTIVVTAQRREENLQDVPISITALSAETLEKANVESLIDVQSLVPNMHFGETGFGDSAIIVNIRGQGIFGGRNPAVGMYINEVPMPQVGPAAAGAFVGGEGMFFDLENVQVLKGPQGTLFGRNTTGGAVLLTSRRPGDDFGGNIKVGYGDYDNVEVEGGIDIPLVEDRLSFRGAVLYHARDGYVDVASTPDFPDGIKAHDVDATHFRGTLSYTGDTLTNDLVVSRYENNVFGNQQVFSALLEGSFIPFIIPEVVDVLAEQNALGIRDVVAQSITPSYDTYVLMATNRTEIELSDLISVRGILGFTQQRTRAERSYDGSGLSLFHRVNVGPTQKRDQYTAELQLLGSSSDNRFEWAIGAFYYNLPTAGFDVVETIAFNSLFGPPSRVATDYAEESLAYYAQGSYALTDALKLTLGARYTLDYARGIQRNLNFQSNCVNPRPPFDATCTLDLDDSWKVPTWNVTLDYQANDDVLVYGSVRRGFRSGGYNLVTVTDPDKLAYDEELITSFELGFKADTMIGDVPARLNAAGFYDEFKDAQITLNLGQQGDLVLGVVNAADAEFKGAEVELVVEPIDGLQLNATASYLDVKYKNFPADYTDQQIREITKNEIYGRPKYSYTLGANYEIQLTGDQSLDLFANYAWVDDQATDRFNPLAFMPSYGLLDLTATWRNAGGLPIDVTAYATNVLDKEYRNYVIAEQSLGFAAYGYGAPRMYGLRLNYRFGSEAF